MCRRVTKASMNGVFRFYNSRKIKQQNIIFIILVSISFMYIYVEQSARQHLNVMSKNTIRYVIAIFTRTPCKLRILARATIILE